MPQCRNCRRMFPNKFVAPDGRKRNLSRRKYCPDCSPIGTTQRGTMESRRLRDEGKRRCPLCCEVKSVSEFYRCAEKTYAYCKRCDKERQRDQKRELKRQAVLYAGGSCEICGYDRYFGALEFHHRNAEQKELAVARSKAKMLTPALKQEIDKCHLLCAVCHREVHGGITTIPQS